MNQVLSGIWYKNENALLLLKGGSRVLVFHEKGKGVTCRLEDLCPVCALKKGTRKMLGKSISGTGKKSRSVLIS